MTIGWAGFGCSGSFRGWVELAPVGGSGPGGRQVDVVCSKAAMMSCLGILQGGKEDQELIHVYGYRVPRKQGKAV